MLGMFNKLERTQRRIQKLLPVRAVAVTDQYAAFQQRYFNDPAGFWRDCFTWPADTGLAPYQEEILSAIIPYKRVSPRGPHGLGKSAMLATTILWFALTRDGRDWKIPTTASAWRQLEEFLWPEVHKWARRIRWDVVGREPFRDSELLMLSLKLRTGSAFALASDKPSSIEGAHADHMLYVFDESKAVPDAIFDAAEGAFSTPGEIYVIAASTPGERAGRFFGIHTERKKYHNWWVRPVTLAECVAAGRISIDWADMLRDQWGADSAQYQNRVLGQFAEAETEGGVIPRKWVKMANERWRMVTDEIAKGKRMPLVGMGVDVGGESLGGDPSVIAPRYRGNYIGELEQFRGYDPMRLSGAVALRGKEQRPWVRVDSIGIGAGVAARLRNMGFSVDSFGAGESPKDTDSTGELEFENQRAYSWWYAREMLDPMGGHNWALPPDQELEDELCAPVYGETRSDKITIERKESIKKRIGRSTNKADAVLMAMLPFESAPVMVRKVERSREAGLG